MQKAVSHRQILAAGPGNRLLQHLRRGRIHQRPGVLLHRTEQPFRENASDVIGNQRVHARAKALQHHHAGCGQTYHAAQRAAELQRGRGTSNVPERHTVLHSHRKGGYNRAEPQRRDDEKELTEEDRHALSKTAAVAQDGEKVHAPAMSAVPATAWIR